MPGNNAVKSTAKTALKRFKMQAVTVSLMLTAVLFLGLFIADIIVYVCKTAAPVIRPAVGVVYALFVLCPFFLGTVRYFWRATGGVADNPRAVFYYFENNQRYLKTLTFNIMLAIRIILMALVVLLPYLLTILFTYLPGIALFDNSNQMWIIGRVFQIVGFILLAFVSLRYYLAPVLYVSREDVHWTEAMFMSKQISRQSSGSFIILIIGFLGWILLSFLGLPIIYTLPYMLAAYAVHSRYAVNIYNHSVRIANATEFPAYRSTF